MNKRKKKAFWMNKTPSFMSSYERAVFFKNTDSISEK